MQDSLQQFVETVNGTSHLRIEHDFGGGFVRLQTSEAERRQAAQDIKCTEDIVLELMRNSRDAHAAHVFIAMSKDGVKRHLTVIDDGEGIPNNMHERVFEPRVTSKLDTSHMDAWGLHGRGMALFSISVNATDARVMASDPGKGCSILVETDVSKLTEKTDQSSFPTFVMTDQNVVSVRGPRNILRTACEFAIDCRSQCSIYVGSPAEICSTIFNYGLATLSTIDRLFCCDSSTLPITKRLATAKSPKDLSAMAAEIGLMISERTARRIIDGQIGVLSQILDNVSIANRTQSERTEKRASKRRANLSLLPEDKKLMASRVMEGFEEIAERYYLNSNVEPSIQVRSERIVISIPVVKLP